MGYGLWCCKELDTTERLSEHAHTPFTIEKKSVSPNQFVKVFTGVRTVGTKGLKEYMTMNIFPLYKQYFYRMSQLMAL